MFTQSSITDGIAPVDESFLQVRGHGFQACRHGRELQRSLMGAGCIQSVTELIVQDVGTDSPVSALSRPIDVGGNEEALPQAANLIVDEIENPVRVTRP